MKEMDSMYKWKQVLILFKAYWEKQKYICNYATLFNSGK